MDEVTSALTALNLSDSKNAAPVNDDIPAETTSAVETEVNIPADAEALPTVELESTNNAAEEIREMRQSILDELTVIVQKQLDDFFLSIKGKLNESVAKSCAELHFLNCTKKDSEPSNDSVIELDDTIAETNLEVKTLRGQIDELENQCRELQTNLDKQIAQSIEKHEKHINRIEKVENNVETLNEKNDSTEQQGRKETVEFHNIPLLPDNWGKENTDNIIIHFCQKHLKLKITVDDISVSHRQIHPEEQRKQGSNYIPSIYCKFVSRKLAKACIDRSHLIKDLTNHQNQRIFMMENLTFNRRVLWGRVKSELHSFQYKWIKNGKIFVRKLGNSRSVMVLTERHLNSLLIEQRDTVPPAGNVGELRRNRQRRPANYDRREWHRDSHIPPYPFQPRSDFHVSEPPPFPFPGHVLLSDFIPSSFFTRPRSYRESLIRNVTA